jgi:glycosyltransferase involved in cell wall biosynthesis
MKLGMMQSLKQTVSVTVVIPCYNCASTLGRTLMSVIEQTVLPEKVILINDASIDATQEVIKLFQAQYGNDWLMLVELDQNHGPAYARNQGIKEAKSDYVAFLDADDSWHPRKLEIQYAWMRLHPEVALTGHRISHASDISAVELQPASVRAKKNIKVAGLVIQSIFNTNRDDKVRTPISIRVWTASCRRLLVVAQSLPE